jgi:hypothetical protein
MVVRAPARRASAPWAWHATVAVMIWLATMLPLKADEAGAGGSLEFAVKATYLYKFIPFVQWPSGATERPTFAVCEAGNGPFGPLLDEAVRGQSVEGRPIVVRRFATLAADPGCAILFVAGSPAQSVAQVLAIVRGHPVLTVTDAAATANARGIINFVVTAGHVRFEIDAAAAAAGGLSLSSKLLSLALNVRPRSP